FHRVVGVGVDRRALAENPFLDEWRAQDLNRDPVLPFANGEFDGATLCGAIQYLARPGEVIREVARILRPGATLIVTFSNRCLAVALSGGDEAIGFRHAALPGLDSETAAIDFLR